MHITDQEIANYTARMYKIAGVAMKLYNELGHGYAEPIYQECLSILCDENDIPWEREVDLNMYFHNRLLEKTYKADFVCYGDIIVELKAVCELLGEHRAQLFNYLRITGLKAGMLINFGETPKLHCERYLYNEETDKFDLVYGDGHPKPKYYPGTNIPYDSL